MRYDTIFIERKKELLFESASLQYEGRTPQVQVFGVVTCPCNSLRQALLRLL
jgi:hypothetical protein